MRKPLLTSAFCLLLTSLACGPSGPGGLKPIAAPDAATPCPAGRKTWRLEVLDRRADRRESGRVTALVADSIRRSFPGCAWNDAPPDAPLITIEIDTFSSTYSYDGGGMWDASAIWTVLARDPSGRILTEFECDASASRPNYRESNNELMLLTQIFEQVLGRAVTGLREIPPF